MRFIYALTLASFLFFFGCDQGSDLTSPFNDSPDQQLKIKSDFSPFGKGNKKNPRVDRKEEYPPGADSIFVAFKLPASEIPNLQVSQVIDGDRGGEIEFEYEYRTRNGNTISIEAELEFPKGAFNGVKEISMRINNENVTVSFYPHMVFDKKVEFELEYSGLDLSGYNPDSIDFLFQNYDGTTENVDYDEIYMNTSTGTMEVEDVDLTHFSRYGFVN